MKKLIVTLTILMLFIFTNSSHATQPEEQRLIIKYKTQHNLLSTQTSQSPNIEILKLSNKQNLNDVIQELKQDKSIELIEEDTIFYVDEFNSQTLTSIDDSYFNKQWALNYLNIPKAWNKIEPTNKTIIVAVIDTGIEMQHEDLKNKIHPDGYNFILDNNEIYDLHGHGTNISGVIAAEANNLKGIAGITGLLNIQILPLQVSQDGSIKLSDFIKAINYAIDKDVDIINASFSSSNYSEILNQVIQDAVNQGIIFVAGSGNQGHNNYHYPASYDNVISVGSIGKDENVSYFSNYNDKVDIVAPGEKIYTTTINNSYIYKGGTSLSTSVVSGVIAIMKSISPSLTQQEIYDILITTANDKGEEGKDIYYGYGIINPLNAINKIYNYESEIYKNWGIKIDVEKNKIWTIIFNKNVDKLYVSSENVYIKDIYGNKINQDICVDNNKIIIYPPGEEYLFENSYKLYVTDKIKSINNDYLIENVEMMFIVKE